ncbi:MAG: hypothetical protein DMD44_07215 [Gemmatimonadetes bacterium]|nr:MAG: hypothetical protein DMD44_07215 [Gemmatimonadota bacterium]
MRSFLALAFALCTALRLVAQDVGARLDGRVPPDVQRAVQDIAADAAARGLPTEPLVQKAIEGGAKRVPADRLIAAVRALAARLAGATEAVRAGGLESPKADVVEGGADGLSAGLSAGQVSDLVRATRAAYDPALVLRVAATLAALGVPAKQTVQLVEGMISDGRTPGDLLGLPGEVQAQVARGATPAQAAAGLSHGGGNSPPGRPPDWVPPGQAKPHRPPNPHKP